MAAMLSTVWISCALVIVALAICFATVAATPKSTSAGVALNTLHPSHAPAVIKRRLKRTTAIEDTETSEERTPTFLNSEMEPFLDKLKSISAGIAKQSPRNLWWLTPEFSDRKFLRLKLDKLAKPDELAKPDKLDTEGIKLFNDQSFLVWQASVEGHYKKFEEPYKKMLKTLKQYYGNDDTLVKLLAAAIKTNSNKEVAERLLEMKLTSMMKNGKTANELFDLLELKNLNDELLASPLFWAWVYAIALSHPKASTEDYKMVILSTLRDYYPEPLTPLLVAGSKLETSEGMFAIKLYKTLFSAKFNHDITMGKIYKDLELTDRNENSFWNPRFSFWLNFFKARYHESYQEGSEAAIRFTMDTISFLRKQFDNDRLLRNVFVTGSTARNTEVSEMATQLLQRLDELTIKELAQKYHNRIFGA